MMVRAERGFLLMAAIFIIVTLAAIGSYLVVISTGQIEAASQDEQASRAYLAARTGIDWGAFQILRNPTGAFATACVAGPASQTVALSTLGAPAGATAFQATVACTHSAEAEDGATVDIYVLTSTGCNRTTCPLPTSDPAFDFTYVERQLQLVLSN